MSVASAVRVRSDRLARRLVSRKLAGLQKGTLEVTFADGSIESFGEGEPRVDVRLHDDAVLRRLLLGGEIALGESYVESQWDSQDLDALMRWATVVRQDLQFDSTAFAVLRQLRRRGIHSGRHNSRRGSHDNIHEHYDEREPFFVRLLDASMSYSSGNFASDTESLDAAQERKHAIVCERLDLQPMERVLDIGVGWGAFATYAARERGCRVHGVSVSADQIDFVKRRLRDEGLDEMVDVVLCDYRDVEGQFDKIACLGMLEHVGHDYLPQYFATIERLLGPGGTAYLQFGAVPHAYAASQRRGSGWTQQYMFPGAELPSLSAIDAALARTELAVVQMSDWGRDCALTYYGWLENLRRHRDEFLADGMPESEYRAWDYYLSGAGAAFLERTQTYIEITLNRRDTETLDRAHFSMRGESDGDGAASK